MKSDKIYLEHIIECIDKIERFLDARNSIKDQEIVDDAIVRNLQIMSESTQKLSDNIKLSVHDIPWRDISDFRNKLVHDYLGIDLEIIYDVINNEIPKLKKNVINILKELKN